MIHEVEVVRRIICLTVAKLDHSIASTGWRSNIHSFVAADVNVTHYKAL